MLTDDQVAGVILPLVPNQQVVSFDQGYLTEQDFEGLVGQAERTSQLIAGLIRYLRRRTPNVKRPT